jgi:hypothetical protein
MEDPNTKNLYFKSWYLSDSVIEAKLADLPIEWRRLSEQFFFFVTSETYDDVLAMIAPVNRENGSVIRESEIDYTADNQVITSQLTESYKRIGICNSSQGVISIGDGY